MPLVHRRQIVKTEIIDQRVECHGHHGAIYVIRYAVIWDDGQRLIYEWRRPIESVLIGEETAAGASGIVDAEH